MANLIRLTLATATVLMFSQTLGSVITLAQTLDRVTAEKVAQIAAIRN
jgi:Asp-tRNA(Asn)/Glu-tRNA(Gln) amidotransferase C subunit